MKWNTFILLCPSFVTLSIDFRACSAAEVISIWKASGQIIILL